MSTAASLPPAAWRHRNHALAAARRTRAVQLRTQGWTYEAIARQLGYASPGHSVRDCSEGSGRA